MPHVMEIGHEVAGRRKDGTTFPVDLAISRSLVKDNMLLIGIVRDITERKQAQDEILRLNASLEERVLLRTDLLTKEIAERKHAEAELLRFKNVLDNTLDMIFMFEPESLRFVYVNQGALLSMGYSRESYL